MLVLTGRKDLVVPDGWAKRLADAAPHGRLELVPGPHVIMYHHADGLAAIIAAHARA